ncbi:signal transduction histidine kinase [Saccharothrix tamanrassetensis]|uniref:histidine kinase n=1 Tax=Saccharothrix tamanrassetensis TaxID=1051531 RepID=A0A841CAB2_9PSEU|nr:ATP-binding protein [Saccharothrix tamanrassetensis]MBB5954339.1 signal transduction histidine kinase [Saccharothrix tamanrassetensis]
MSRVDQLRDVELFATLNGEQLRWLDDEAEPVVLQDGDVLFEDGEIARHFYVLLEGELLITKVVDGREHVLSRHSARMAKLPPVDDKPAAAHQFTGELPLLAGGGYVAKATAVGLTTLLAYDRAAFLEILVRCPQVCQVLLPVLAWRIHSYEAHAGRRAMLEGLGTLTAGLAHELNNPAAAVSRSVAELGGAVRELADWSWRWGRIALPEEHVVVTSMLAAAEAWEQVNRPRDAFEAAEFSDAVRDWLEDRGVTGLDGIDTVLADHGVVPSVLATVARTVRPEALDVAVGYLGLSLHSRSLVRDVSEAGQRISALLHSAKAYTNLDRAPVQVVDLAEGLEATLAMQSPRLTGVRIHRDYADLPPLTVYPSELNQVWTNLIDNAVDAMNGSGQLWISTKLEAHCAVVEIRDSGIGIAPDVLPLLFQPFFTTKDIGQGTGLGLHLSHDIITQRHNGSIDVTSVPGDTRFTVRLPADSVHC